MSWYFVKGSLPRIMVKALSACSRTGGVSSALQVVTRPTPQHHEVGTVVTHRLQSDKTTETERRQAVTRIGLLGGGGGRNPAVRFQRLKHKEVTRDAFP